MRHTKSELWKRQRDGDRWIVITEEEIFNNSKKHTNHRTYVADRFQREHGLFILDFTKLEYRQSRDGSAVAVWGKLGVSLSARVE